jgi:anti-anti-sigma factor
MEGVLIVEPTVLPLRGELCIAELADMRSLIEATIAGAGTAGAVALTIDLAEVTLLTAAALRVLATTQARLAAQGGALRLRNPQALPRRVLEIAGFDHLLEAPLPA